MLAVDLQHGLAAMELSFSEDQQEQLLAYLDLLQRWNQRFNLTAIRDPEAMLIRHLFDSLVVVPHVTGNRALDVGTGGGLPGIPLAIALPGCHFSLLDSNGKKTRFLTQVKAELGLRNVEVIHERVEDLVPDEPYEIILSRAFASLSAMIGGCLHLLAPGGVFLALKGQTPVEEIAAVRERIDALSVLPLAVPELDEERCLVRFTPS